MPGAIVSQKVAHGRYMGSSRHFVGGPLSGIPVMQAVLYEMLTGKRAFSGAATPDVLPAFLVCEENCLHPDPVLPPDRLALAITSSHNHNLPFVTCRGERIAIH
jgi:hypothetical protein